MKKILGVLLVVMFAASAVFAASTITITGDNDEHLTIAYDGEEADTIEQIWTTLETLDGGPDDWDETTWGQAGGIFKSLTVTGPLKTQDIWRAIAAIAGNQLAKESPLTISTNAAIPTEVVTLTGEVPGAGWEGTTWAMVWSGLSVRSHDISVTLEGVGGGTNASALAKILAGVSDSTPPIPAVQLTQVNLVSADLTIPDGFLVELLDADAKSTVNFSGVDNLDGIGAAAFAKGATIIVANGTTAEEVMAALKDLCGSIPEGLVIKDTDGKEIDITDAVNDEIADGEPVAIALPTGTDTTKVEAIAPENRVTPADNAAELTAANFTGTDAPSGGKLTEATVKKAMQIAADVDTAIVPLEIFKATVTAAEKIAAVGTRIPGSTFTALDMNTPTEINLVKILSPTSSRKFSYVSNPAQFADATFTLLDENDAVYTASIKDEAFYHLVIFVQDGGAFDLDKMKNGSVTDPAALVANADTSGGGGCNAGLGALAFALVVPFVFKKKNK